MPAGPCPHLAVNLHCTWTARPLPVVTVETTTCRTCVVLSTILQLLYFGQALYYMPTDIITFSHPRIFQVWELLWSPFCIQENANFKRLKNLQGHTSQKWCTQNLDSHSTVLNSKFFEPYYSVCSETPSSSHCSSWTLPSTFCFLFLCLPSVSFLVTLSWF